MSTEAPPAPSSPLDPHEPLLRAVDEASRRGYTVLGLASIVIPALTVILSGRPLASWAAVGLFVSAAVLVVAGGRLWLLSRQDARLRAKIAGYCAAHEVLVIDLIRAAVEEERFEFFVKLAVPLAEAERAGSGRQP